MKTSNKSKKVRQDRLETEAKLLEAAKQVFSEQGFEGATTRMIAKKCDINLALITRYFKSKQGLLLAVLEKVIHEQKDRQLPYAPCDNLCEESLLYAESRFQSCMQDTEFMRIVMGQFMTDRKLVSKLQSSSLLGPSAELKARFEPYFKKGKNPHPQEHLHFIDRLETSIIGSVVFQVIIKGDSEENVLQELKTFIRRYCEAYQN